MLEVSKLSYAWPDEPPLFDNLSFRLDAGEKVVLLGPNGCGKSTLLRLLNGLLFAEQGEIHWQGRRLDHDALCQRDFARDFRCNNTLLLQHSDTPQDNPTVRDEIASGARQLGLDDVDGRVQRWADELNLTPQLGLPLIALSGGQRQKMALACLLVLDPQLMLLDEPSAALDPHTTRWLVDKLLASDKTVLISTNDLSLAGELGNRAMVMNETGKLLYDGSLSAALTDPALLEAAGLMDRHPHQHQGDAT